MRGNVQEYRCDERARRSVGRFVSSFRSNARSRHATNKTRSRPCFRSRRFQSRCHDAFTIRHRYHAALPRRIQPTFAIHDGHGTARARVARSLRTRGKCPQLRIPRRCANSTRPMGCTHATRSYSRWTTLLATVRLRKRACPRAEILP